jgi:hypothetical protein
MDASVTTLFPDASYIVAGLLVTFYAWNRFNTPRTVRSQTSRVQYFGSGAAYLLSCLGLLMGLSWMLRNQPAVLDVIHTGSEGAIPDDLKGLDAALVAALILTTLLPSFPVVRDIDRGMLSFFHKMGAIPFNALIWAQRMATVPFAIGAPALQAARQHILNGQNLPNALTEELTTDPDKDPARFQFTRNIVLYVAMTQLPRYPRFANDFREDVAQFEERSSDYFANCVGFFASVRQMSETNLVMGAEPQENFKRLSNATLDELHRMLARILLFSSGGEAELAQKLNTLGFAIEIPAPIRIPSNLLALDAVGVVAAFALSTLFIPDQMPLTTAISIGVLVAVNHVLAGIFALLPKQVWSFANVRCTVERPFLAYVISALSTLTVTLPIAYGFYMLRHYVLQPDVQILPFLAQCKWLLLPTVLAFALAFMCDNYGRAEREPVWLRWAEGAGLGILLALTGLLTMQWLLPDQMVLHPTGNIPTLWAPVIMSALIGLLFGSTIPHWYRRTVQQVPLPDSLATARMAVA